MAAGISLKNTLMNKFQFNCRRVLSLSVVVSLALMLTSCHYYKEEKDDAHQEEDLIANIEGYGIDTIAVEPGDTLCSARVDDVLRHYPEFYHAAKKAKKAYGEWQALEAEAHVGTKTQVMSVDAILNDALYGPDNVAEIGEWPDMAPIDSAYFKLIGQSGLKRKSAIGHARRAWISYQERLRQMAQTVPEQCRARYIASITARVQQLMCEPKADKN